MSPLSVIGVTIATVDPRLRAESEVKDPLEKDGMWKAKAGGRRGCAMLIIEVQAALNQ